MTFTFSGVNYKVNAMCLRPHDVVCLSQPTILPGNTGVGQAGGVGMRMEMTLMPDTVSFKDLRIMERATEDGVATEYFNREYFRPWWNHGKVQGAGILTKIGDWNIFYDRAIMEDECPQLQSGGWTTGSIIWTIPIAWRERQGFSTLNGLLDFTTKEQKFTIDAMGTVGVEKFNCSVERDIQGHTNVSITMPPGR